MRWTLTFNDGFKFVSNDPPLSKIPRPYSESDIEWISLRYKRTQYNFKLPECLIYLDDSRWGILDIHPMTEIKLVCMYRGKSVLGINDNSRTRKDEIVFIALGCKGKSSDGKSIQACLRVYPDGRAMMHVEKEKEPSQQSTLKTRP